MHKVCPKGTDIFQRHYMKCTWTLKMQTLKKKINPIYFTLHISEVITFQIFHKSWYRVSLGETGLVSGLCPRCENFDKWMLHRWVNDCCRRAAKAKSSTINLKDENKIKHELIVQHYTFENLATINYINLPEGGRFSDWVSARSVWWDTRSVWYPTKQIW